MTATQNPKKKRKLPKLCKCGAPGTEPHHCAYRNEIEGDPDKLCNCCSDCTARCAEEI